MEMTGVYVCRFSRIVRGAKNVVTEISAECSDFNSSDPLFSYKEESYPIREG
jgi:hypothetical protein